MNFKDDGIIKIANIDKIGESKEVVVFNPKFKVVYFDFEVGKGLPNHTHNGYASIIIYEGSVSIEFVDGEKYNLNKGDLMQFDARIEHNVIAKVKSRVLVTISERLTE